VEAAWKYIINLFGRDHPGAFRHHPFFFAFSLNGGGKSLNWTDMMMLQEL